MEIRSAAVDDAAAVSVRASRVQAIVDDLRDRLGVVSFVHASPVPQNTRVASVTRSAGDRNTFVLSIEEAFLDSLTDDELTAMTAHELGHVWIFTHHPFLQTEELANEIALKAVSRRSLEQLYEKLWSRTGQRGNLEYFPH